MFIVTVTERTPLPKGQKDTNTYHTFHADMSGVARFVDEFSLNWGCLVSMTITPFKE